MRTESKRVAACCIAVFIACDCGVMNPELCPATIRVPGTEPAHAAFRILKVDESTYVGGKMGVEHPISWQHTYDGGRAWYTAMGHTGCSYSERPFLDHLVGGIEWAAGIP